jgi:hypothetical protein
MSILSSSFSPLASQRSFAPTTLNSSSLPGGVFDGRGNDFLHPRDILGSVNDFSRGISSGGGNASFSILGNNPIPKNANPVSVLNGTTGLIGNILSPSFGSNIFTPSPSLNQDLAEFNPLIWQNPNSLNVLLGTMDASNKIFGGNGLIQPNLVPPLYPFLTPVIPPFQNFVTPVASQAQLFPNTFLNGSPLFEPVIQPPVSNSSNVTQIGLAILQVQTQISTLQKDISDLQEQRAQVLRSDQTGKEDKARVQGQAAQLQAQISEKTNQLNNAQQTLSQLALLISQARVTSPQEKPVGIIPGVFSGPPFGLASGALLVPLQEQPSLLELLTEPDIPVVDRGNILSTVINGVGVNQLESPNGVPAWIA